MAKPKPKRKRIKKSPTKVDAVVHRVNPTVIKLDSIEDELSWLLGDVSDESDAEVQAAYEAAENLWLRVDGVLIGLRAEIQRRSNKAA